MRNFSISPAEMVASLWRNRNLVGVLLVREIVGRYRGTRIGIFWSFLTPLFLLGIYTFVFSVVFKTRWSLHSESKTEFALVMFAGLIVFNLFAECVTRAPTLILGNPNYVKKLVFPLEILPWVTLGSAIFHAVMSLCVWLIAYLILFGSLHVTVLLLPFVCLPLLLFVMGLSWALASLGVYFRDVSQFLGIIVTMTMFLSPIFYPASALPEEYRQLLLMNPLTPAVESTRAVLFWGEPPSSTGLALYLAAGFFVAWIGFAWFQKTRKGFADVL